MDWPRCWRRRTSVAETSLETFSSRYTLVLCNCATTCEGGSSSFFASARAIKSGGIKKKEEDPSSQVVAQLHKTSVYLCYDLRGRVFFFFCIGARHQVRRYHQAQRFRADAKKEEDPPSQVV